MIKKLNDYLRITYKTSRQIRHGKEWPPYQSSSFVNLALIHHRNMQTRQELLKICNHYSAHFNDSTGSLNSNSIEDIQKIFMSEGSNEPPKRILIEGAPGTGKTILAKEIAYQWAIGNILQEKKLLFLLYLREPKSRKVKSIAEILSLFSENLSSESMINYLTESYGVNVAFVFDGFDEYPSALRQSSYITNLIEGGNQYLPKSVVVVTSRPATTLSLCESDMIDRRIEVLGFPKEERVKYISQSLKGSNRKIQQLDQYLQSYPIIDNLCYTPLYLEILLYLFQQDSLPKTLTEMNKYFIINTIYRYLKKHNLKPPGELKMIKHFPPEHVEFVNKLSQLAFEGLQKNQLVFTLEEVKNVCPELDKDINGYGLLLAVQHYSQEGVGDITSVNFLHFTMQEYLAALHVSTLSDEEQSSLMRKTFWDDRFSIMWMMYVGTVGVKSSIFKSFINTNSYWDGVFNHKKRCLHLFNCYMEAKSNAEMPKAVTSIFTDHKIIINYVSLLPHHISSLIFFISASSEQQWKVLSLCGCSLRDIGMNSISRYVVKNNQRISALEYIDLSENITSPWSVYYAIIRHCCVNSLTLCGDEGMHEYVKNIADSLQYNLKLESLTLCKMGSAGIPLIESVLVDNTTLKELYLSWGRNNKGTNILRRQLKPALPKYNGLYVNILYDEYHERLSETINLSNKNINEHAAYVLAFGLYNNTKVKKLDLSDNHITIYGMNRLSECIEYAKSLTCIDLSRISSSPWNAYCVIIKQCCVEHLIVFGDYGMKDNVEKISDCLQGNLTLQSLTICKIGSTGIQSIEKILHDNIPLKKLNLSWGKNAMGSKIFSKLSNGVHVNIRLPDDYDKCLPEVIDLSNKKIDDEAAYVIAFGLRNNTTIKKIDLSYNIISRNGMDNLSEYLKHATSLEYVDLSENLSSPWRVYCAIIKHCGAKHLTLCGDDVYMKQHITDSLQTSTTLESLTLYKIGRIGLESIMNISIESKTLSELNLSWMSKGTKIVCSKSIAVCHESSNRGSRDIKILYDGKCECSSKSISMSNEGIIDDAVFLISYVLYNNTTVQRLDFSLNKINDNGAKEISNFLKSNQTVRELNLSKNYIGYEGMRSLSKCIENESPLQCVDLSGNKSPPWDVYCAIIRHCCFSSLKLYGDEGMSKCFEKIIDSLEFNAKLQSLTLCTFRNNAGRYDDMVVNTNNTNIDKPQNSFIIYGKLCFHTATNKRMLSISINLCNIISECLPETISLSKSNINHDMLCLIALGLYNNTTVKKLDLSQNNITDDGAVTISECLKQNNTLQELDISCNTITDHGAVAIDNSLKDNDAIKKLNLSRNYLCVSTGDLFKYIIHTKSLEYIDLSGNELSAWGVYYIIIRNCHVRSLTLCGDKGINEYVKEIIASLQKNTILQSLTLCKIGRLGLQSINDVLIENTTLKELNMTWTSKGKAFIQRKMSYSTGRTKLINLSRHTLDINILYDDCECSSEGIIMSNKSINDDAVYLISFGLYNNTMIQMCDLSCNKITDNGAVAIGDCLRENNTLHILNLSNNNISCKGAKEIAEAIRVNKGLHKLNISKNPLCDDGVMQISDSLKHNKTLLELDLSESGINDEGSKSIAEAIKMNTALQKLVLSHNNISDSEAIIINDCLKKNDTLKELELSNNNISKQWLETIAQGMY